MRYLLTIISLLLLSFSEVRSCSCWWGEKDYRCFIDLTSEADAVVLIKVKRHTNWIVKRWFQIKPGATRVKILDDYKNNIKKKRIKIWGNQGWMCWYDARNLKRGHKYVMNLYHEDTTGEGYYDPEVKWEKYEMHGTFVAGVCGEYVLEVKNDSVEGIITDGTLVSFDSIENLGKTYNYYPQMDENHRVIASREKLSFLNFRQILTGRIEEDSEKESIH